MTQMGKILERLLEGPAVNTELNRIAFRYSARIFELRQMGLKITTQPLGDGLVQYRLG